MKLRVGDWVEVRSKEEILKILDKRGRMEKLPFMPQMFQYCGQRFRVVKRAHKTCDWVYTVKSRRLANGVHLGLHCDGEAYGGCQTTCTIFWKEAWLKRVDGPEKSLTPLIDSGLINDNPSTGQLVSQSPDLSSCTLPDVMAGTRAESQQASDEPIYVCQGTQVPEFTTPLPWWHVSQYIEDYTSGNVGLWFFIRGFIYAGYTNIMRSGIGIGAPMRWLYNIIQSLWGGIPFPGSAGKIPVGQPTPTCSLNLQPGEMVRVKPFKEILATLSIKCENRGLSFDAEMVPYCGGIYRVRSRVKKFIDEKTGKMVTLKKECIMLDDVWCQGRYSHCRLFCPRNLYPWWHEIWLERAAGKVQRTAVLK